MIQIHKASARGQADYGWPKANYAFSFAEYFDPQRMGLSSLRVLNEDFISAGGGFPNHGHRDMEIIVRAWPTPRDRRHTGSPQQS